MSVFKGTKGFYDYEVNDVLVENLRSWIEYGLLEMGAYKAVKLNLPTSGLATLKLVKDDRYSNGTVYEGMGPSWVWQTDISAIPTDADQIFRVSGVYINNTFYPTATTSGLHQHIIDYKRGRVVFLSDQSKAEVKCEYVFREIDVFPTNSPQWRVIVDEFEKQFSTLDTLSPSGMASILKENRIWLPCVVIDLRNIKNTPLQLGGGEISHAEVDYHIFSNKAFSAIRLCNILGNQGYKVLSLYDVNSAPYPYNFDGSLASGALTYKTLSNRGSGYFWTFGHIDNADSTPYNSSTDVFRSEANHSISIERYLSTY